MPTWGIDGAFQLKTGPNSEASDKLQTIAVLREWIETAIDYFENNDFGNAEELLNKVIEVDHTGVT